jgi:Fe-S cluster assembly protein SufD
MTQTLKTRRITREAVERLSARYGEPGWLLKRRLEAWRLFEDAPEIDPLSEEWKRIDTSALTLEGLSPFAQHEAIERAAALPVTLRSLWDEREELAGRIVQLDSETVYQQLDESLAKRGVAVSGLHTAARDHEAIVKEHLLSTVTAAEWKYLALHGALWSGGCFVYVPADVEVELPIEYTAGLTAEGLFVFPHILVVAEPNSSVTLIHEGASPDASALSVVAGAVEVVAREGAHVRLVDVQRWGHGVQDFVTARARLAKDASFEVVLLGLGGSFTKSRVDAVLAGDGSRALLSGLFLGDSNQRFYYDTLQDHIAPKTESDLLFKAALTDHAAITWNGVVDVRKTASQASANQTSRNLLLSDTASASPTPILEISAYDVAKCSHGATVGPVDREQLFYLQSRGIPEEEAERMLVDGFLAEVLERVPSERLRGRIERVLQQKLGR